MAGGGRQAAASGRSPGFRASRSARAEQTAQRPGIEHGVGRQVQTQERAGRAQPAGLASAGPVVFLSPDLCLQVRHRRPPDAAHPQESRFAR